MIAIVTTVIPGLLFMVFSSCPFNDAMGRVMQSIWGLLSMAIFSPLLNYFWIRYLLHKENVTTKQIGFSGKYILNVLYGFGSGGLMIVFMLIPLYLSKSYLLEFHSLNIGTVLILIGGLLNFFTVAFTEEIIFRGYIQYQTSKWGVVLGCLISAALFSVHHLINGSYSLLSLTYLFLAGLLFSVMRLATNSIVFSMSAHLAWNWLLTRVFGIQSEASWMKTSIPRNTIWNGGNTGPEAGVWGLFVIIFAIGIFILIYRNRQVKIEP